MSRYQTPYLQYFDAAGKPLAGGKLFFYEAGTNDLKTVFTDIDQTIPSENPVTLNANGSVSNIFYSGLARVVLQNATGTQIFDIDDVGPEDLSGLPPLYVSDATYSLNDVVKTADGLYYRSTQNGNAGNVPSVSSEYWEKVDLLYTYNANNSYQLDDVVKFNGQLYISTITANQGNSPSTSNNWRKLTTLAEFEYLDGGLTLNKVNYPAGTKAHVKSYSATTGGRNSYWVKQAVSGPASKTPAERLDLQCTDAIGAVWALQHSGVVYISSIGGNENADNGLVFQAYDNKADILDLEGKEWPCTSLNTDSGSQREVLNSKVMNGRLIVTNSLSGETLVQTFSQHLDSEAQLSETKSPIINWDGLNVLWLGTSIPHQGAGVDGYPERLADKLNFTVQNYAWSGSHAFYDIDGDAFDNATVRALTMTEVDRQAGLSLYGPTSAYDDSFDLVTKPSQMTCDYRIKRQFETSPVDVVVLDHNHNDRKNIKDYTANIKTIGSVTLGALTTFDLTDVSGLNVGDGCYVRVEGIDNLDYAAGRITAIAGNDVTVGIDSTGFTGTFTSGQLHWVDRTTIKGAWDFLIAYTKNMGIQFGKEDVKIILCGAASYFTNNVDRDHSIWSVNRAIREIAQDWDLSFFDVAHALRLTYRDHLTYLPDAVHPSTPETREIFTNVWAKWLRGGAGNFYNPQSVLQRNKTIDNEHDQPALYSKYDSAYAPRDVTYKEQDPLIDDDFSGGLGDWTQLGTGTQTVVSAPWGSGDAVQFSVLAANTAPYLRQDVAVGETPVLEFDFYLPSVDLATGTTQQLTIASISGAGGSGYSVTITQTAGSVAQVRGTYNKGGFGLSPVVSFPNSAFIIEAATKYRARIDIVDGYAQFSIDGQVMFSGAIDNDLIGAATTILVGPTFTNMSSDFEVFIGNVVAQAKESLHVMTTAELQKTVQSYTLDELTSMNPTLTGRRVICSDRADAPLKLMADSYTALPGDITAANGRVWALQLSGEDSAEWFESLQDSLDNPNTKIIHGGSWNVSSLNMVFGKTIRNMSITGVAAGDLINVPNGADNITLEGVELNGNNISSNIIKVNDSAGVTIKNCNLSGSTGNDIAIRPSTLASNISVVDSEFENSTGFNILIGKTSSVKIEGNEFNGWGASTFDAIGHADGVSNGLVICNNDFTNDSAGLFAIECAGSTQRQTGAIIKNNRMHSAYCGISGRFVDSEISSNKFYKGDGNWRSGLEIGGYGNQIFANWIYDGAIAITTSGDTGDANTTIYSTNNQIHSNYVRCTKNNGISFYLGAGSSGGVDPLADKVSIHNNIFDMSEATGTTIKVVWIGNYQSEIIVKDVDFTNNTVIGPEGVSGPDGVRIDGLAGSGRLKIKTNTFIDTTRAVRFADDVYDMVVIKLNDAARGVGALTIGTMTNTTISENDTV